MRMELTCWGREHLVMTAAIKLIDLLSFERFFILSKIKTSARTPRTAAPLLSCQWYYCRSI